MGKNVSKRSLGRGLWRIALGILAHRKWEWEHGTYIPSVSEVIIHPLLIIWQADWIPRVGWFVEIRWNNSCITATPNDHKWPPWKIYTTFCCKYFHDVFGWFWASPFFCKVCAVWFQTAKTAGGGFSLPDIKRGIGCRLNVVNLVNSWTEVAVLNADLKQVLMYKSQYFYLYTVYYCVLSVYDCYNVYISILTSAF